MGGGGLKRAVLGSDPQNNDNQIIIKLKVAQQE